VTGIDNKMAYYENINDLLFAMGVVNRSSSDKFYCTALSDLQQKSAHTLMPFRKAFYAVTIIKLMQDGQEKCFAICNSPGHLFSWHINENSTGYMFFFKRQLVDQIAINFSTAFSIFNILHSNYFALSIEQYDALTKLAEETNKAYNKSADNDFTLSSYLLMSVLQSIQDIANEKTAEQARNINVQALLSEQLQELVSKLYLEISAPEDYATLLNTRLSTLEDATMAINGKSVAELIEGARTTAT
jgi:AraC family transcriptional regulator, transcriptional activator of pobA